MRISQVGIISTSIVIVLGILIVIQPYIPQQEPLAVLLSFDVINSSNLPQWCNDLSVALQKQNVEATIFIPGNVAEQFPQCVKTLSIRNDIGSQTYNYVNLKNLDYTTQLYEVESGKAAIDKAGHIESRLFKAPFGETDENIYSILNRTDIIADFSYDAQYNKYYNGKYLKFN